MDPQKLISETKESLKKANSKLRRAITNTILSWPYTEKCWIDNLSEPTLVLQEHKVRADN